MFVGLMVKGFIQMWESISTIINNNFILFHFFIIIGFDVYLGKYAVQSDGTVRGVRWSGVRLYRGLLPPGRGGPGRPQDHQHLPG